MIDLLTNAFIFYFFGRCTIIGVFNAHRNLAEFLFTH
jgi:hypothetical protein